MDAGRDKADLTRSCEGPSWSDFDRGFCTDQSLSLSGVSADGLLKPSRNVVLEYSEPSLPIPRSLNYSTGLLSPFAALNKALSPGNTAMGSPGEGSAALCSPVEGKSSTPYERVCFQKSVLMGSLDLSCVDLTSSHPSWEVSVVKARVESPGARLESTWSPINSGTPSHPNVSEELQRSWKEMIWKRSGQTVPDLREEQSSSNLAI